MVNSAVRILTAALQCSRLRFFVRSQVSIAETAVYSFCYRIFTLKAHNIMLKKGLFQIYTGHGKGKTTAAFGQALRAAGRGCKVLIYQFLKPTDLDLGERTALENAGLDITVEASEKPWDMSSSLSDNSKVSETKTAVSDVLQRIALLARQRKYDVIILDELAFCLSQNLADIAQVRELITNRDTHVEIILTGRDVPDELIKMADLVTEMKKIKHPFDKNISARRGIEY